MAPAPTISVVVPCFNHGAFIDETLASIFAQSFQDFEVIIVNDGSTDEQTNNHLAAIKQERTKVLTIAHCGLPGARNAGIRQSRAEHICCVDADDLLEPNWFQAAIDVLRTKPEIAFVSHWLKAFGDETWDWKPERCDLLSMLDINRINGAALVRRHVLENVGFYDETMRHGCEDWDLWLTVIEKGYQGLILPEVYFRYRRRKESMSQTMPHIDLFRTLIEKHRASYRDQLAALFERRELCIADFNRRIGEVEQEYHERYLPLRDQLCVEAARLKRKVQALEEREQQAEEHRKVRQTLAEAESYARTLEQSVADTQHYCADLNTAIENHASHIAALEAQIHDTASYCADLNRALQNQIAHSKALEQKLKYIERLNTKHKRAMLEAQRKNIELYDDIVDMKAQDRELKGKLADAEQHIAKLRQSLSWRVTGPLRSVAKPFVRKRKD